MTTTLHSVPDLLSHAQNVLQQGQLEDALILYNNVLDQDPKNAEALNLGGMVAWHLQKLDTARDLLIAAAGVTADNAGTHNNLGLVFQDLDRHEEAVRSFTAALKHRRDYDPAMRNLIASYRAMGRNTDMYTVYGRLLDIMPDDPILFLELGDDLKAERRVTEAEAAYRLAYFVDPTNPHARQAVDGLEGEGLNALLPALKKSKHVAATYLLKAYALLSKYPPYMRQQQYLRYGIGHKFRYERCKEAWQPHLENSKKMVREAIQHCQDHNLAVMLGSGLLLDLPLEDLAKKFKKVLLIDVVQVPEAYEKVREYSNVELVEKDATMMAEKVFDYVAAGANGPIPAPTAEPCWDGQADLVASLNMASQMYLVPYHHLQQTEKFEPEILDAFAKNMVEAHFRCVEDAASVSCLITDMERRVYDGDKLVTRSDLLMGAQPRKIDKDWLWDVAPHPEVHFRQDSKHKVGAAIFR